MKNNYINEAIGSKLKELRTMADYSLQDVADRAHISRYTYYNFERGTRTISLDLLKRICGIYNYDYLELVKDVHEKYVHYVSENTDYIIQELENRN